MSINLAGREYAAMMSRSYGAGPKKLRRLAVCTRIGGLRTRFGTQLTVEQGSKYPYCIMDFRYKKALGVEAAITKVRHIDHMSCFQTEKQAISFFQYSCRNRIKTSFKQRQVLS